MAGGMRFVLIALIRLYQRFISPFKPKTCRFYPTCSHYAVEAISVHGSLRGTLLAVWRVLRCNPLNPGGLDPVPPEGTSKIHTHYSTEKQ